jgi:hypothetical protein
VAFAGTDRSARARTMSAVPLIATEFARRNEVTRCATSRHMRCSKFAAYSITSSASASILSGTSMPRAFAVLRLITSANFTKLRHYQRTRFSGHTGRRKRFEFSQAALAISAEEAQVRPEGGCHGERCEADVKRQKNDASDAEDGEQFTSRKATRVALSSCLYRK